MRLLMLVQPLLLVIASLNGVLAASAPKAELVVLERLRAIPQGWFQKEAPSASKRLRFRIALRQENAHAFEQHVIDISTPDHVNYGHHMDRMEMKRMLQPSEEASAAVLTWLESQGVPGVDVEDDGDWVTFWVPTVEAERMLDTKFHYYSSSVDSTEEIRTLQYSVPTDLHQYIQMIQPTTRFGQLRADRNTISQHFEIGPSEGNSLLYPGEGLNVTFCNNTVTPQCLRALYNFGDFKGTNHNRIGVCGYLNEYAKYRDFAEFTAKYAPYTAGCNFTSVLINGGLQTQNDTEHDDVEANLDVQYAFPLSHPAKAIYYSTGGLGDLIPDLDQPRQVDNQNEPYLDFLHYILGLPDSKLPTTLTTSYGEDEQSVPAAYANRTCNLFAQLGARGVSVIFSSGDTGVGSACQTNDGNKTTRFLPTFPAACPFVTSVGGTQFVQPEAAIDFSSGGFSDFFPRPAYQDDAVSEYLGNLGDKWKGLYNPAGRGFPDVAAQSYNFTVIEDGAEIRVGGTSAAAPAFAAIVANLNGNRMAHGQPPLGFLNPFIYSVGYQGLTDIVDGGSRGCTGRDIYSGLPTPVVPYASWNATPGWDPVTGYGSPNLQKLLRISGRYRKRHSNRHVHADTENHLE